MYEREVSVFGSRVYLFGETHVDGRERTAVYNLCKKRSPEVICIEVESGGLRPAESEGHRGLQTYANETNVDIVGIDERTASAAELKSMLPEEYVERNETRGKDGSDLDDSRRHPTDSDIEEAREKAAQYEPFFEKALERREEAFVMNIIEEIRARQPSAVFVLLGQDHIPAVADTLEFFSY